MARSCKCAVTGEIGTTDTFVKIGKHYYKNRAIYDAEQKRKADYKRLIDYICGEFLGYGNGQPFPPALPKKIKELSFYDYEVILETFKRCHGDICYWLEHKQFSSEYGKLSYIFTIVRDKIANVNRELQWKRSLEDNPSKVEPEYEDLSVTGTKAKGKNISSFLDSDEL